MIAAVDCAGIALARTPAILPIAIASRFAGDATSPNPNSSARVKVRPP